MQRLLYFILIAASLLVSNYVDAQSKPKRDVSKDRSVIAAKKKEAVKKANVLAEQKRRKVAKKSRTSQKKQIPKVASYLRVNQLEHLNKTINYYGGGEMFNVNTDGDIWNVTCLPVWCHLTKYFKSFALTFDPNPSHDERSDCFKVQSDNLEVKIDITQSGTPLNISANFNYGNLQHNCQLVIGKSWENCLKIYTNITIKGSKNEKCLIVASFTDENQNSIKAAYGYSQYALSSSKDVYVAEEVIPTTDEAQTFNITLYLPNNALYLLKKKNVLRCHLALYCVRTASYLQDANYLFLFDARKKKGKVITKKL